MPKKAMETLTESMFYVLMAFSRRPMCGIEVSEYIERKTKGRIAMGPATLYTILGKFEKEKYIREIEVTGRKRTYCMTQKGMDAYKDEVARLKQCILDAEGADDFEREESEEILPSAAMLPV